MPSFSAPFYGKINRLSVNPSDNSLWVLTAHPMGRAIAPTRLDVQAVLSGSTTLDSTTHVPVSGVGVDILGHHTGLYIAAADGKVHRLNDNGDAFVEVFDCGEDFGLQGFASFSDGKSEYPALEADGSIVFNASQNRKLVLVGSSSAQVIDVAESGSFEMGTILSSSSSGTITAWDASTVFGKDGYQTHHCAFGWSSGAVTAYFTDDNSNTFNAISLMHASEVAITAESPLHEGKVNAVLYVEEVDAKGRNKRYLVSAGLDGKLFQTSLLEGIAIPRTNHHGGQITGFVAGAFADGDGAYRGLKFGRFYTLSNDGTVKAFLNEYINEQAATYKASTKMLFGTLMMLSVQHTSGVYSKGDYLGTKLPTPHLILSNGSEIRLVAVETTDKKDVEQISDLRQNGRMSETARATFTHGQHFVNEMGWHDNAKVRQQSLARFKDWDAEWLMDSLKSIASENSFPIGYREGAINALKDSSHPRRIVLLEEMLRRWGNTESTQELAYNALKGIFTESLRPQTLVLENGSDNSKLVVIGDLADVARGNGSLRREALQILQGLVKNRNYDLALRAYDHICGEGDLDAAMPSVEGVLFGIFSNQTAIRNKMAHRLAERGLMHQFETALILRRLLESNDEMVRERAIDVSLLRASKVGTVLRFGDESLHSRLYVLENGAFKSTDDQEALLRAALPSAEEVNELRKLFREEDASVLADLDVLVEFSSSTQDDVSVYALQARASFGFESATQGLLKLSNSRNQKVMRQAVVGLGYMVHLDDAHTRICGITLNRNTPLEIGCVSIYHAIKGYEERNQNSVLNILQKVLDGGNPKLRETAITIGQALLNDVVPTLRAETQQDQAEEQGSTEEELKTQAKEIKAIEKEIRDTNEMLSLAKQLKNVKMTDTALATLKDLNKRKEELTGVTKDEKHLQDELSSFTTFFKQAVREETLHLNVRKEVYKSFWMHNLETPLLSTNKTETLKLLLNLRDRVLFNNALKDLCAHIDAVEDREWALALFKQLIDQDIVPEHHSNVWEIWTTVADFAEGKLFESDVLRIGFECSAPCNCRKYHNGSHSICEMHRIRRDAFLRVLSASGDWLAGFIRDALNNAGKRNGSVGESAAVLAVSDRAKEAVARMGNPPEFILSMLTGEGGAQKTFACELLLMYPRFYNEKIQQTVYDLRRDGIITGMLCDKTGSHLMTLDLYEYFLQKIIDGELQYLCAGVERFAKENNKTEDLAKELVKSDDLRLVRKGIQFAAGTSEKWGEDVIEDVLHSDDERAKIAYTEKIRLLERAALRANNDGSLKDFVSDFYANSSSHRQLWVVESLRIDSAASQWKKDFLAEICTSSKAQSVLERAYQVLNSLQSNEPWVVTLLKAGLNSRHSEVAELSFQGLLFVNKLLGPAEERAFLTKVSRNNKDDERQEQAIAAALTTTASWRVQFILDALNDTDSFIRGLMCEKVRSVPGLDDQFFQNLRDSEHEEVREMAIQVLTVRGLYRPTSKATGNLKDIILEAPPPRPDGWYDWSTWYWKVQAWKDRKIDAIIAAGKTHDPQFYQVFCSLLSSFGYRTTISNLWSHAMYATSWHYEDWWEFIILHTGWVLKDAEAIEYAQTEGDKQDSARLRVAWNVAAMRSGQKSNLLWIKQQYYDNGWRNYHRRYIKREYIFEGLFAVDSSLGVDGKDGEAFAITQELMNTDRGFVNDIFRLNMLRLTKQGGPVDFIGVGYTSSDEATNLEAVCMRERQYSKGELLSGVVSFLNEAVIPEKNPYELANVGGVWYDVVRLTLELHMKTFDSKKEVEVGYWKQIAQMLSCQHPQLRARAVNAYFRRHVYGEEKERFKAEVENFARQLSSTVVDDRPLTKDRKSPTAVQSRAEAFDGYIGLIRKTDYGSEFRRDALTYITEMCEQASEPSKVLPVLKAAITLDDSQIRFRAYSMLIAIQNSKHDLVNLDQLIQIGLRSTDSRLKRMALSLIWGTDQLEQADKVAKLESILKNANDVSARFAFDLLHAFAGRPAAWDKADTDKDAAYAEAEAKKMSAIEAINKQIESVQARFEEFRVSNRKGAENLEGDALKETNALLAKRRTNMYETVASLRADIRAAEDQYRAELASAEQSHEASMVAPLSAEDAQTWSDACARRDELVGMAIDAYFPALRLHAVDSGLTEVARRRPYFEKEDEEFTGYYNRLLSILEKALTSPYSDLQRHTALSMAKYKFSQGYKVILRLLASHDASDQSDAISALVELGPIGLTKYTDDAGEALPRTALILLERASQDEFGTVNRWAIFNAIGRLQDRHSSVRARLFEYLNQGTDSPDYSYVFDALINISGCGSQILRYTDWADLTPSDYSKLQRYMSHELDWDKIDLAKFETLYQDVYDEGLLAEIMNNLFERADYSNLPRLISIAEFTKGFDVTVIDGERSEPVHKALSRLAKMDNTPMTQTVRTRAIDTLIRRLDGISRLRTEAQNGDIIAATLDGVLDSNTSVIDDQVLNIAVCLANNKYSSVSSNVFEVLYSVATTQTESVHRRTKAMSALGHLGDERAVLALLNAAGMDAYGEDLVLDPDLPSLSSWEVQRLQNAAADGLGGMIFAQECEGIYQLLSKMSRSRDRTANDKGYSGLSYFLRSEKYALQTAVRFAEEYQKAVNSNNNHKVSVFADHMSKALTSLATESHPDNADLRITPETEAKVKEYILATFFGEVFELDGEAFNPLNVQKRVFEEDNESTLEAVYQVVRQWVHGPHQTPVEAAEGEDVEMPIDFSYLDALSVEERTVALKAERKLFENVSVDTKYTTDVSKVLAEYLSPTELLEMVVYAHGEEMYDSDAYNVNTVDRYYVMYNALMSKADTLLVDVMNGVRKDYTLDINGDLRMPEYTELAQDIFETNTTALEAHMDEFVSLIQWLKAKLNDAVALRRFGDTHMSEYREALFDVLRDLLNIGRELPTHASLVDVLEGLLDVCHLIEDEEWKHNSYEDLFETYLEYGQVNWELVGRHLQNSGRHLRRMVVSYLNVDTASDVLPAVMSWIEDDTAALSRLVDVLRDSPVELQNQLVAQMKVAGPASAILLVLSRLRSVDVFKEIIESLRDEKGNLSAENGVRMPTTPRTSEKERTPLLAEAVFNSLAVMATDKAEYYLRDLAEDTTLEYAVRQAAAKAANVAYRRRVPLHIRRAERS